MIIILARNDSAFSFCAILSLAGEGAAVGGLGMTVTAESMKSQIFDARPLCVESN